MTCEGRFGEWARVLDDAGWTWYGTGGGVDLISGQTMIFDKVTGSLSGFVSNSYASDSVTIWSWQHDGRVPRIYD